MAATIDKRAHTRLHTRFETTFRVDAREGLGVVTDLSPSGARLDYCTWTPDLADRVQLSVEVQAGEAPLQLEGSAVRATERGFVLRFEKVDDELKRTLEALELPLHELMGADLPSGE